MQLDENTIVAGNPIIYPNPVNDILNLKISSLSNNKITLSITDIEGRALKNKITNLSNGETIVQIDVSRLSPGLIS